MTNHSRGDSKSFFPFVTEEKEEGRFLLQMNLFPSAGVLTGGPSERDNFLGECGFFMK